MLFFQSLLQKQSNCDSIKLQYNNDTYMHALYLHTWPTNDWKIKLFGSFLFLQLIIVTYAMVNTVT